jgi:hypothetical protein
MPIFQLLIDPQGEARVVAGHEPPAVSFPGWRHFGAIVAEGPLEAMNVCVAWMKNPILRQRAVPLPAVSVAPPPPIVPVREIESILETIALCELGLPDLRTRMNDAADFNEHAIWSIRAALLAAFKAGQARGV